MLRVLDRKRVEPEDLAQDREIVLTRPVEVEPEEAPLASSSPTVSGPKCISVLPRSWTTRRVLGALRLEGGACASAFSPASVASPASPVGESSVTNRAYS